MDKAWYIEHLTSLNNTVALAQEELTSWLNEYEEEFGTEARDELEERFVS